MYLRRLRKSTRQPSSDPTSSLVPDASLARVSAFSDASSWRALASRTTRGSTRRLSDGTRLSADGSASRTFPFSVTMVSARLLLTARPRLPVRSLTRMLAHSLDQGRAPRQRCFCPSPQEHQQLHPHSVHRHVDAVSCIAFAWPEIARSRSISTLSVLLRPLNKPSSRVIRAPFGASQTFFSLLVPLGGISPVS